MTSSIARPRQRIALVFALSAMASLGIAAGHAADTYDRAVQHAGRSTDDLKRDIVDHPAELLRLAGIRPGMQVADVLAADGYYSELLSDLVGPTGHVLLLNNVAYDTFSNNAWRERIGKHHLSNVEHRTVDMAHMGLGTATLDAAVLVKVYHDLYWVSPQDGWPKIDAGAVLDQIVRALKPGGAVLVVDHSAKPGTGSSAAQDLHRIDEAYARHDFEAHGLEFVSRSDVLRRPDDKRDRISYKPPMLGKTDRFVYVFRKPVP
ncbi:MAG: class I SAM-dependent methyltransferase [Lysobacterales bacterium]